MEFKKKLNRLIAVVSIFALMFGVAIPNVTWLTNKSMALSNTVDSSSSTTSRSTRTGRPMHVVFIGNSISEDISGLAFAYKLGICGVKAENGNEADYTNATFYDSATKKTYDVISVGAIVYNTEKNRQYTLEQCNGSNILNIPAARLFDWDEETITFAIRVIDIPEKGKNTYITVMPYVTVKDGSETITFYAYDGVETRTFNEVLFYDIIKDAKC